MEIATDVQEAQENSPESSSVHAVNQIYECCGTGCTQEASFICPMCKILGIDETLSSFCSQACFEADWTRHKHQHEKKNAAFFNDKRLASDMTSKTMSLIQEYDAVGPSSSLPEMDVTFQFVLQIQEEAVPMYGIKFCDVPNYFDYFGSAGKNAATIYHVAPDGCEVVHVFVDEDSEENFYTCAWSSTHDTNSPLFLVAGMRGIIKTVNIASLEVGNFLVGHGAPINEIRIHPVDNQLCLSSSKDESVRLWNLKTSVCVAIFAGEKGHRDEVLSIDFHPLGTCFASAGMDNSIKIWNLSEPAIKNTIEKSYREPVRQGNMAFVTYTQQTNLFSTNQVHDNYVDAVRWVGNCLISKSTKNLICLWQPDASRYKGATLILRQFAIKNSSHWFLKMETCVPLDLFAVGNTTGAVHIYNIHGRSGTSTKIDGGDNINKKGLEMSNGHDEQGDEDAESNEGSNICTSEKNVDQERDTKRGLEDKNKKTKGKVTDKKSIKPNIEDGTVEITKPINASAVLQNYNSKHSIRDIHFSKDSRYLIYCNDTGLIFLWSIILTAVNSDSNSNAASTTTAISRGKKDDENILDRR